MVKLELTFTSVACCSKQAEAAFFKEEQEAGALGNWLHISATQWHREFQGRVNLLKLLLISLAKMGKGWILLNRAFIGVLFSSSSRLPLWFYSSCENESDL